MRVGVSCIGATIICLLLQGCDRRSVTVEKLYHDQANFVGLSYFLPRGIVTLTISKKAKEGAAGASSPVVTLKIDDLRYIPDPDYHYSINVQHDIFYDDNIAVEVDPNGLLKGINSETVDRTPDVIRAIAQAPQEIIGAAPRAIEKTTDGPESFEITFTLDPTRVEDRARLNQVLAELQAGIEFTARPYVALPDAGEARYPDCNVDPCFRTALPYALELHTKKRPSVVAARQVVVLPNKHIVGQIPLTRAPFVTKKVALTFTNGMLTRASLDNKSEALAFVQLPIDVTKAIVGIPSALFNFQVKQIQADNLYLSEQQKSLDLQRAMIEAQSKLLAAQASRPSG